MKPTPKNHDAVVAALDAGDNLKTALVKGGYSQQNALRGQAAMSETLKKKIGLRKLNALIQAGRRFTPAERADIARGALLANVEAGRDSAAASIKLMGLDKEVSIFGSDNGEQVIQLVVNQSLLPQPLRDYGELYRDEKAHRDGRLLRVQREIELAVVGSELPQEE